MQQLNQRTSCVATERLFQHNLATSRHFGTTGRWIDFRIWIFDLPYSAPDPGL